MQLINIAASREWMYHHHHHACLHVVGYPYGCPGPTDLQNGSFIVYIKSPEGEEIGILLTVLYASVFSVASSFLLVAFPYPYHGSNIFNGQEVGDTYGHQQVHYYAGSCEGILDR